MPQSCPIHAHPTLHVPRAAIYFPPLTSTMTDTASSAATNNTSEEPKPPSTGDTDSHGVSGGEKGYNSHWRIFRHAKEIAQNTALLSDPTLASDDNEQLLRLAGDVMESWGKQWATIEQGTRWASFLNKKHLKEEVEESLVALAPLILWLEKTADDVDENNKDVTVVDVCCGKGICSILLSYLCGRAKASNYRTKAFDRIAQIVMLDRETSKTVDWGHIAEGNSTAKSERRPMIEIWEGCNLHETDAIYDRFEKIPNTLALLGIHLCRHLSPCCVGLTNALGRDKAKFLCLAPCCLPRQVRRNKRTNEEARTIKIPLYEEPAARKRRIESMKLREQAIGRGHRGADCYLCKSPDHFVRACPQLPSDVNERLKILQDAAKDSPCWKCGELGHSKKNCPLLGTDAPSRPRFVPAPFAKMDCYPAAIAGDNKFPLYCELLAKQVQNHESVRLIDAPLAKKGSHEDQGAHWNSCRKNKFIVVER